MRYKAIFWDWNGTLIDDVNNALQCVNDMLVRKNKPTIDLKQYYDYIETPIIGFYRHILTKDELDFDEISKNYHLDYARHMPETNLAEGSVSLMKDLGELGVKQFIVSANHQDEIKKLLNDYDVSQYFDGIIGSDNHLADSKEEKAKELFNQLNYNRNEVLLVGDTLHDYEVANALGIDCVLVSYGHQGRRLLSKSGAYIVDSVSEIRDLIFDERTVDLHCHTTFSDGTKTPTELLKIAKEKGICAVAITDHDAVNAIPEALKAGEKYGVEVIPGIEFSVVEEGTDLHIVGLFLDTENQVLNDTIKKLHDNRIRRMHIMCDNLCNLGMPVTYDEALEFSDTGFVGRPHIAKALQKKGFVATVSEAFEKYIGTNKPAYCPKLEINVKDAVTAINAAGGKAFLAHLNQTGYDLDRIREALTEMKGFGLYGIEGYYSEYTPENYAEYRKIAGDLGLAYSGGSDYHGDMKPGLDLGNGYGSLSIPYFVLENLKRKEDDYENIE